MNKAQKVYSQKLIDKAIKLGAVSAHAFTIDQIVFDPRTLLKCMFGCGDWNNGLTCPSANPQVKLSDYKEMFSAYSYGVIVHANDKKTNHDVSFLLESMAFLDGYHFAFSLSDCALCKTCAGFEDESCRFKKKARPAFHSVGIDVFTTAKNMGLPLYPLKEEGEEQNWYAAVFVE